MAPTPEQTFGFDPTHGYDLDSLLAVPAPAAPADFDGFWRGRYEQARAVRVAPATGARTVTAGAGAAEVYEVAYTSVGGLRVGGWLTLPADGEVRQGCVVTHGYGGRQAPDPALLPPGTAAVWPCLRGLGARSLHPGLPSDAAAHVLHGIGSRASYVHGGCTADVWCAATALLELVPAAARRLTYAGTSFGGGIGALALPWDDRFAAAALTVPSFGNHPLRLTLPCTGSGESVRRYHAAHPEVASVLAYFDAATAATRITVPTHVAPALLDPAVPPPGQFAVHNALRGPKELRVLTAGHVEPSDPEEEAALRDAQRDFLVTACPREPG
ncbi:acetylxylan esterase [Streptomyces sp. WMMC500]|uniref:acetylxylan esterase n=1 Tax=Streptomyces sp. WMMC500 TaxID=3015154 RepID=UPI00248BCBBD|nr:acetylxylan esterase [Streptomyces sp. WMMC500]WBB61790.1 acetylxylan esterase [Streptomyces sp. WMMC500]